jgi:1-deoxy-D-xylulose-5-phosphate synthase
MDLQSKVRMAMPMNLPSGIRAAERKSACVKSGGPHPRPAMVFGKGSSVDEKTLKQQVLDHKDKLPRHVAMIMDGNGRWATRRGLPRTAGHEAGARRIRPLMELCGELGVNVLTLYAFSTENWNRPQPEVNAIMKLLGRYIESETPKLAKKGVRLCFIGGPDRLSDELREKMARATELTSRDYKFTLNLCINYGGRDEIVSALERLAERARTGGMAPGSMTAQLVSDSLYTAGLPDPDMVIRTGGEQRISNFLLWQIAYAEIIFHTKYWPDFMPEDFLQCLADYLGRERRFGALKKAAAPVEAEKSVAAAQPVALSVLPRISGPDDVKALSPAEREILAREIRDTIVERVSERGGHLASNLGIVELSIALHTVFDSPRDRIVWDVGHQCYPHKLLTGRGAAFETLRTPGGVSGFPKRSESDHDAFDTGHGTTAVSAALGMAAARDLQSAPSRVAAVCGDGAMTGGMVFEALNHAGDLGCDLTVILNDNSFSISPATGALSRSLNRIRTSNVYVRAHQKLHELKERPAPGFRALSILTAPARRLAKYLAYKKGIIFEELGFTYVGPVDGHDTGELINVLRKVNHIKGPVLVHVLTQKGRGYEPAEKDPAAFHGVSRLPKETAEAAADSSPGPSFTRAFSESLGRLCERDERIVGITAAMPSGTGLEALMQRFPGRIFDVGMAEPHAVTFAAGMAAQGMRPVVAVYSTFLQRAYDQVFHDVCLQGLPVVFALDRAGLVSRYGSTHQGLLDIAFLRHMPGLHIMAPRDTVELGMMLEHALSMDAPVAIRYPAGAGDAALRAAARPPVETGSAEILAQGADLALWGVGPMACAAARAAKILARQGLNAMVVNVRSVSPLDETLLTRCYEQGIRDFITIEDHLIHGGFGSLFLETANRLGMNDIHVRILGAPQCHVPDDSRDNLLARFGLTPEALADAALEAMRKNGRESASG